MKFYRLHRQRPRQPIEKGPIVKNYSKAIAGFVGAVIVGYFGAQDGGVTQAEWLQILGAGLAGAGVVFVAPKNKPKA